MTSDIPRTAVDLAITDPVERARAELKAALAAIEIKSNVPLQVEKAADVAVAKIRRFAKDYPVATAAIAVAKAAAVGAIVWWCVDRYVRR
ncbi:hypothetical protein GCM10009808_18810 [Microbacterium sediminicola]|uniref:DUF3618 domain-containing protein n=1 Tax=Microbacterium sediminicola TaxID=415210 RepID=A0ABP4UAK5_9MICO